MENNKKGSSIVLIFLVVVILLAMVPAVMFLTKDKDVEKPNKDEPSKQEVATVDFPFSFLKLNNNKENLVYSPLSIKYALKMLEDGASGNTKTQIEKLLAGETVTKYDNLENVLSLANGMFINDSFSNSIKQDYENLIVEKYNGEIVLDPFDSAKNVNDWISKKTFGMIKNVLNDEDVTSSKFLLANALAIKMGWQDQFRFEDTTGMPFYLEDGKEFNATMMKNTFSSDAVSYYKDNEVTSVSMNLEKHGDTQLEFVAIMPEEKLSNYVESFSMKELNNITEKSTLTSKKNAEISIPKFVYESDLKSFKDNLMTLGVKDAFDPDLANFTKISELYTYYITNAIHKAKIDFTEKGVEAAAVTVFMFDITGLPEDDNPVKININKPFLYVIRDKKTNEIWFTGTVYQPNSWEKDANQYKPN